MFDPGTERTRMRLLVLGGAFLLLLVQAALLPPGAVWITDNGNKQMVLENLVRHGTPAMVNPAAELDPGNRFFPDGNFHFRVEEGRVRSIYPEFFSALALPGCRLFGDAGLWILPVGGTLAALALFLALIARLGLPPRFEALSAGLLLCGSPLLFYSGTFWEMTAAAAFPLAALLAARKRRWFLAGLLLGAGLWLREEFYLIALASGIAALVFYPKEWKRCLPFGAGFLALAVPLWVYNSAVYGHILGFHGALYYTHNVETAPTFAERIAGLFEGFFVYLWKFNSGNPETVWYYWLALTPMFLLPVAGFLRGAERFKAAVAWAAVAAWAFLLWLYRTNPAPLFAAGLTVGFVTSSPLLAGFFLNWRNLLCRGPRPRRAVTLAALLYSLALPLVLTRSDIGIIWGARHYLLVFPVLFALGLTGFVRLGWRRRPVLAAAVAAAALALQATGIRLLFTAAEDAAEVQSTVAALEPRVIVSDVFFLPEMTPRLFFDKQWLYLGKDGRVDELVAALRDGGAKRFTLILSASPQFRQMSDAELARLLKAAPPAAEPFRLRTSGKGFLDLMIVECRLQ